MRRTIVMLIAVQATATFVSRPDWSSGLASAVAAGAVTTVALLAVRGRFRAPAY